ncbi:hypothetical protein P9112_002021 [Eukaryota sp. TZLM1-RC]
MCKFDRVDSFLELLLSKFILENPNIDSTRYNRASMGLSGSDLSVPGLNGSFTISDAMSTDPVNSKQHFINFVVNNLLLTFLIQHFFSRFSESLLINCFDVEEAGFEKD